MTGNSQSGNPDRRHPIDAEVAEPESNEAALTRAEALQRAASDPLASVFVSASAGSGKTKLLIDRMLRLMLPVAQPDPQTGEVVLIPGIHPSRILSLTYTRAAAAEMSTRLQALLGRWVTMDDAELDAALGKLDVPLSSGTRDAARSLFADVLDCPGGMRISTIHAFCQSLLRRFPLEAQLTPQFQLVDDADALSMLVRSLEAEILSVASSDGAEKLKLLSQKTDYDMLREMAASLRAQGIAPSDLQFLAVSDREGLKSLYRRLLCLKEPDADTALKACVRPDDEGHLRSALQAAYEVGSATVRTRIGGMLAWLALPPDQRDPELWRKFLLTGKNEKRSARSFLGKAHLESHYFVLDAVEAEALSFLDKYRKVRLYDVLEFNIAALALVSAALSRVIDEKARRGLVDYEDLIAATRGLLETPGAAWVLFQLDGGIEHLLLDEVQDTSPAQWDIARALTDEFFSGQGIRDHRVTRPRTIFAVGDFKQSIFSFQGARPQAFLAARSEFSSRVKGAGLLWRTPNLDVSFRSAAPILNLVDAVFLDQEAAKGLSEQKEGDSRAVPLHRPARQNAWGRVELWPRLTCAQSDAEVDPWTPATDARPAHSPIQHMAESIALWLKKNLGHPPQPGQKPLEPGDVLILVRRRSPFLWALVRALKSHGVDVATLIRANLTDQLAVQDVMALFEVLLLPQDDLMLATVLTSPLGDISDESLMDLAATREGRPLWVALQERHRERREWSEAWSLLAGLQARLDYASPYDILSDVLGRFGGRARFIRRLGVEARDALDDLLTMAMTYDAGHTPSMQGFLAWLKANEGTIKRDAEAESNVVRIMTVHASKGLQARLVILPDTTPHAAPTEKTLSIPLGGQTIPFIRSSHDQEAPAIARALEERAEAAREESRRLLYVALTRAQDWLVVCGWEPRRPPRNAVDWYALCAEGFARLPTRDVTSVLGLDGPAKVFEMPPRDALPQKLIPSSKHESKGGETSQIQKSVVKGEHALPSLFGQAPDWRAERPKDEPRLARPLAPSRPEGAAFGVLPAARSPIAMVSPSHRMRALRKGIIVHRLLQFLPDLPETERRHKAERWLAQPGFGLDVTSAARIVEDVMRVIHHPDLGPLFEATARPEQAITGVVNDVVVVGQIDRYAYKNGVLYLCDFKTNQNPPRMPEHVPITYQRQMAAYAAVLRQIYKPQKIVAAFVWTEGARVTVLSPDALETPLALPKA